MIPIDRILPGLQKVKRTSKGYIALCPAHADQRASLSIQETGEGTVLLKCFAGCTVQEIVSALGLTMKDLFVQKQIPHYRGNFVDIYDYRDKNDHLLYQVCRTTDKQFPVRRPNGEGGWIWNIENARRVIYCLPGVTKGIESGRTIFIPEGEKDVNSLMSLGFVATCNPNGAGKWKEEFSETLKGAKVVILPDNDSEGKKHAQDVARKLLGKAQEIKILDLPGLPEKGDFTHWLNNGGTKEKFLELATVAPVWGNASIETSIPFNPLELHEFLKKEIPPVEYWIEGLLPKRGRVMISSQPGVGKSFLSANIALALTTGKAKFLDNLNVEQAKVLLLDFEMGESLLKERFSKMCTEEQAIGKNLYLLSVPSFNILKGKAELEKALDDLKINVLIVDPLSVAWMGDENKKEDVKKITGYFNTLVVKYGLSVITDHHWRKTYKGQASGGEMAAGSHHWLAWIDVHFTLKERGGLVTVTCAKNRLGPKYKTFLMRLNGDSLWFEFEGFLADSGNKFTDDMLSKIFDAVDSNRVSVPDLEKNAIQMFGKGSRNTIKARALESSLFRVDETGKTHFVVRVDKEEQDIEAESVKKDSSGNLFN